MYRLCENIVVSNLNGEIVVSRRNDPSGNMLITFNQIGQLTIQSILEENSVDLIVEKINKLTGVSKNVIYPDIDKFLLQLIDAEIIEVI